MVFLSIASAIVFCGVVIALLSLAILRALRSLGGQLAENSLLCTICLELLVQPVTTLCGHSFCLTCLKEWMPQRNTCPNCNAAVQQIPAVNIGLRDTIDAFRKQRALVARFRVWAGEGMWEALSRTFFPAPAAFMGAIISLTANVRTSCLSVAAALLHAVIATGVAIEIRRQYCARMWGCCFHERPWQRRIRAYHVMSLCLPIAAILAAIVVSSHTGNSPELAFVTAPPKPTCHKLVAAAGVGNTVDVSIALHAGTIADCVSRGSTALEIAVYGGYTDIVRLLLEAHADVNVTWRNGKTPLFIAAEFNHTTMLTALIEARADVKATLKDGRTPLYIAAQNGHSKVVAMLIEAHAELNTAMADDATPLHIAAQNGHTDVISSLIEAHADVNAAMVDGATPLSIAAQNGRTGVLILLIQAHAELNTVSTRDAATPLYIAAQNGHTDVVSSLIEAHADVNAATRSGITPLYIAAQNGRAGVVLLLIEAHAELNTARTSDGATPLYIAAQMGRTDVVTMLIEAHAELNKARTSDGATPLYIAAYTKHTKIASLLKRAGAINAVHRNR